jgi:hypothetical protein
MGSTASIMQLVGGGTQAVSTGVGAYSQSQAMRGQANATRGMSNVNADMLQIQAADAERRGSLDVGRQGLRTALLIGRQRAVAAGQGVDVNSGSALSLQAQAARMGAIDKHTLKMNAYKEAMGMRQEASSQRFQGQMGYMAGRNNASNTLLAGGLNATRSAAGAIDNYYRYQPPLRVPSMPSIGEEDPNNP